MAARCRKGLWAAFIVYALVMLWLLFFQRIGQPQAVPYRQYLRESYNLRPFYTVRSFFLAAMHNPYMVRPAIYNLAGNVLLFVPLGVLLSGLFARLERPGALLSATFGLLLLVETVQLLTMTGSWDVDDIILNLLGTAIGRSAWIFPPFRDWVRGEAAFRPVPPRPARRPDSGA